MRFQDRQKYPVATEVRTHWCLWGLGVTQEARDNLLGEMERVYILIWVVAAGV